MAVPEMAGDYEILQSIRLGGRMMLLGYNPRDKETPYMTCYQQYNLLGEKIFPQAIAGDSYIEIMQIFLNRLQEQQKAVAAFREKRGVPIEVLGAEHCRERGEKESWKANSLFLDLLAWPLSTAQQIASLGTPLAALGAAQDQEAEPCTFRSCFPGNGAGGMSRMFWELRISPKCPIGHRKR